MAANALPTRFATPEELVLQLKTLPQSPRILLKLQQMAGSDGSTVEELVGLIRIERALAARIIRIANSPFYNLGTRCETIEESVQRLGFKEVRQLALTVAACEALSHPLPAYPVDSHALWQQAVACALATEHLAFLTGEDEHLAYTAGLMHSVGMIVINLWVQNLSPGTVLAYENPVTEWSGAECALLGYDQAAAGSALLRTWEFPDPIVEAVRCQYATQDAAQHPRLAATLALGRWLATVIRHPSGAITSPPEHLALLTLRISEQQLVECTSEVSRLLTKARQILGAM